MNKKEMNNKGFSLVELIIVIAIMAILVGVLAPQFIKYVESSRQSTDIQNASEIRAAIEAYVAENDATGTITVSTDGTNMKVAGMPAADLESVGLSDTITCKSTGWGTKTTGSYSCTTYKWTTVETKNSKNPQKDLADAFK